MFLAKRVEPNAVSRGVLELDLLGALEKLLVLRIGVGPSALNIVDTQLVQLLRDDEFVLDGE